MNYQRTSCALTVVCKKLCHWRLSVLRKVDLLDLKDSRLDLVCMHAVFMRHDKNEEIMISQEQYKE